VVTGATGFVGRRLCGLLRDNGLVVRAVARRAAEGPWHEMRAVDLTDPTAGADLYDDADVVFHLAALTHAAARAADEQEYRRFNVQATRHVIAGALAAGVRSLVFLSSVKAMGEGGREPQTEQDPPRPATPYGRTKLEAEDLVLAAGRNASPAIRTAVVRAPLIYGPGVGGNLGALVHAARCRRLPPLPDVGNRRSLVDVRDVARALLLVARHPEAAGRVWLVTDGAEYSTARMCALVRQALGQAEPGWCLPGWLLGGAADLGSFLRRCRLPFPFDRERYHKLLGSACYSSCALVGELGFVPAHTLASAMPDMIAAEVSPVDRC
jgi:nucleoside-diphosphate-sugar epimerase